MNISKHLLSMGLMLIAIIGSTKTVKAQDAHFSQFYASSLYLNPALAGGERNLSVTANHRSQWSNLVIPYVTSQISVVMPIYEKGVRRKHFGGVGVSVYSDKAGEGDFSTTGFNATFAYNLIMNRSGTQQLSFGAQAGVIQKGLDFNKLQWGEQFNPFLGHDANITPNEPQFSGNVIYPDLNFGLMYYFNPDKDYLFTGMSGYSGLAMYHVTRPNESLLDNSTNRLPVLYKYHGGLEIRTSEKVYVSPNVLLMLQNSYVQTNIGAYVKYELTSDPIGIFANTDLVVGAWHRFEDAFIFSIGFDADAYTVGFSYDMNHSSLRFYDSGTGAYEISLSLRRFKETKLKKFSTPRI